MRPAEPHESKLDASGSTTGDRLNGEPIVPAPVTPMQLVSAMAAPEAPLDEHPHLLI